MKLIDAINSRYSTKVFDKNKKISEADLDVIKELLRLAPSSVNLQPWKFIIATSEAGKKKIAESTQGFYTFNEIKVLDASAVVVFCSRINADDQFLTKLLEKEDQDGRFPKPEFKNDMKVGRKRFVGIHENDLNDLQDWMIKQVYLNLGSLLTGVATLGIDAVPMEGFNNDTLDQVLDLKSQGYTSVAIAALGYHSKDDFNATLPKSRLSQAEVITEI